MAELYIIPECFIDTNCIETLVPTPQGYNHQKGCNTVVKTMQEKLKDSFAIGIVDKDKKQVKYVEEFEEVAHSESLYLYKHPSKPHFLIMIYPAMDSFILKCASETNVTMEDFGLPSDLKSFTKRTKQVTSKEDPTFKKLLNAIKKAKEITILKSWIKYLKLKQYEADCEELKNMITE
ncbi:hypothetical protein [Bacteroides sp. GM023]|uniref:hypothetical protein n=1 Tax=Bacteroides sp. GM023 TaxID=2723058 RepID=UPI00168BB7E8|nr:hypothetical protein [Bacteroides sp. GM023]MBD3589057.1 hypothetical protein [Bacteroides sp. GM023]